MFCRSALHHFGAPQDAAAEMARVCRRGGRVVVSDVVVPDPALRDRYDAVHRSLDPSRRRAFTAEEVVELLQAHVGPVGHLERRKPGALPLDDELAGGPATGFRPSRTDGPLTVSFVSVVAHAAR